ncbi:MAG: hypothetical protein ACFBSE_05355 [Prochloraceae cyanobacterium]
MTKSIYPKTSLPKSDRGARNNKFNWNFWLKAGIGLNVAVWGLGGFLLMWMGSTYVSRGAAIVSAAGSQVKVQVPGVGQASDAGDNSPYRYLFGVDPRENYQYIAQSEAVLSEAAKAMNMSLEDFGEPELTLSRGTTVIEFELEGNTPEEAREKAMAFYRAFVDRIQYLREEEQQRQENNTQEGLETIRDRLDGAQKKLAEFQTNSPLKVSDQIDQLSDRLEQMRVAQAELVAEQRAAESRFNQLAASIGISPTQATEALRLLDDDVFQKNLQIYSSTSANLQVIYSKFTPQSPHAIQEENKKRLAEQALFDRSRALLGRAIDESIINRISLGNNQTKSQLIQQAIGVLAEERALQARVIGLQEQISRLENRLNVLVGQRYHHDRLTRDAQVAESIFVSKLAQIDGNKAENATSYPILQLLIEPDLPEDSEISTKVTIAISALGITFLTATGLILFRPQENSSLTQLTTKTDSISTEK